MKTFKQFIEGYDTLGSLPIELLFIRELSFSKEDATIAAQWIEGDIHQGEIPQNIWDKLFNPYFLSLSLNHGTRTGSIKNFWKIRQYKTPCYKNADKAWKCK